MEFSKMLKNKRKQLGLSQEELAEKINVPDKQSQNGKLEKECRTFQI